jgi:hypothetical protein
VVAVSLVAAEAAVGAGKAALLQPAIHQGRFESAVV